MTIATLKAAAAEVRRIRGHRMPPYTEDLCALVDSLPADAVIVERGVLEKVRDEIAGLLGTHGEPCDFPSCDAVEGGRAALAAIDGVLQTSRGM